MGARAGRTHRGACTHECLVVLLLRPLYLSRSPRTHRASLHPSPRARVGLRDGGPASPSWRRRWGDAPMLLAAALLATSPLLVYYSRMYIHESLVGLFGIMALMAVLTNPKWGIAGVFIGLMFATKESFIISMIAWLGAGALVALGNRSWFTRAALLAAWQTYRLPLLLSVLTAVLTAGYFYSDGLHHP